MTEMDQYRQYLRTLRLEDLADIASHVDGTRYPERHQLVQEELAARRAAAPGVEGRGARECPSCARTLDADVVICPDCAAIVSEVTPPHAGFWVRWLADLIDGACLAAIGLPVAFLLDRAILRSERMYVAQVVLAGVSLYNYVYLVGARGQSWGRRLMGITVLGHRDQRPIGFLRALARNVLAGSLSAIPLWLGYLWMLWDPNKQTWHDKIVGSCVLMSRRRRAL